MSRIPILWSLVRHTLSNIDPSYGFEIHVESDHNLVAFGVAHLAVNLLGVVVG